MIWTTEFDDANQRTSFKREDTADIINGWAEVTQFFDPGSGELIGREILGDDGNTSIETYSGGVITERVTTDTDANEPWSSITTSFDATGAFDSVYHQYDNGRRHHPGLRCRQYAGRAARASMTP